MLMQVGFEPTAFDFMTRAPAKLLSHVFDMRSITPLHRHSNNGAWWI